MDVVFGNEEELNAARCCGGDRRGRVRGPDHDGGREVLRVGSYHGIRGQFTSIQAAVNAARPGDWILIGPGDYKTTSVRTPKGAPDFPAAVLVTTRNLHIRGMNRGHVIVDGTRPGSGVCSAKASAQNFGLRGRSNMGGYAVAASASGRSGLNGLMVYKARNVSIENLTACNFLGGSRSAGNEIWFNGGADSGKVGGHGFYGGYLTTTSTYLKGKSKADEASAARYGVFSSNWSGGTWDNIYASNFNDSGFYIGACRQECDQTLNHGWAEYNVLGYSGSNSGGRLVIENSQFDNNEDGFDTNSQNGDNPPPQDGACPRNGTSSITHTHSCWVFIHNYVHDNNNPNVPAAGSAAAGPVGTGMSVSGARDDTIMDNRFVNNKAWGVVLIPYPDSGGPCTGGTPNGLGQGSCLYDEWGDALIGNTFTNDGGYGHPTNGAWAQVNFEGGHPTNCYSGNTGSSVNVDDAAMQKAQPSCNGAQAAAGSSNGNFLNEVLCDTQVELVPGVSACPAGVTYPRVSRIVMHKLPRGLRSMPNPCAGVPSNPWCGRGRGRRKK
ncbi:MAG: hypothetical protein ACRDMX_17925 [Solirubrobacteraceae bacterium]